MPLLTEHELDSRIGNLPPLSPVVGELFTLLEATTVDYAAVERTLSREPVLASRILRLANSSFFGFAGRIGSLREACLVLGSRTLRQTVMVAALMQQLAVDESLLNTRQLWKHTLAVGVIAKVLAKACGLDAEQAFIAGLLHDLGTLALVVYFSEEYRQVLAWQHRQACPVVVAERHVLGVTHGQIGEKLAHKWRFPDVLAQAVGRHHEPDGSSDMADIVHLANVLAHALDYGLVESEPVPLLQPQAWERLGLDWEQLGQLLPLLDREASEATTFEF